MYSQKLVSCHDELNLQRPERAKELKKEEIDDIYGNLKVDCIGNLESCKTRPPLLVIPSVRLPSHYGNGDWILYPFCRSTYRPDL